MTTKCTTGSLFAAITDIRRFLVPRTKLLLEIFANLKTDCAGAPGTLLSPWVNTIFT